MSVEHLALEDGKVFPFTIIPSADKKESDRKGAGRKTDGDDIITDKENGKPHTRKG